MIFDKIILGAGMYGLYAALFCAKRGQRVLVLEKEGGPFQRATYINQARVHMGYHYPRSLSTAIKSKKYFDRFYRDYSFCIHTSFDQIYATSSNFSWTNAQEFDKFCSRAGIRCDRIATEDYFKPDICDGAFLTTEYTYDSKLLKDHFLTELASYPNVTIYYQADIMAIHKNDHYFEIVLDDNTSYYGAFVLNTTYAGINQIHAMLGYEPFQIKYELCEIILCEVNDALKNKGITVMDGPFFSIMPFGKTGLHSLTSVTFTPHVASFESLPYFSCQSKSGKYCTPLKLGNCNNCPAKPESAWPYMSGLAKKYLRDSYQINAIFSNMFP